MSSTNKTTNYDLSQFIGTDKPAWLSDYNGDMGKIDAGIATAQSTATGADGKATANASAIGTLSNLTTEAKTNLVAAVNEVNTNASTAVNTASNAAGTANAAKAEADALAAYFALTPEKVNNTNIIPSSGSIDTSSASYGVTIAQNSTHSLGKVYGRICHKNAPAWTSNTITLNIDSGIHPAEEFKIAVAGLASCYSNASVAYVNNADVTLVFKPDGKILIRYYSQDAGQYYIDLIPCLYFFTDFGDVES